MRRELTLFDLPEITSAAHLLEYIDLSDINLSFTQLFDFI